jgi:hypothetical protein
MRTKTLIAVAAVGLAFVASSFAQVYSVNAVGYVNTDLVAGFNLISNPLDNKNANGNTITNLFASVPEGTTVYKFNPATGSYTANGFEFGEWSDKTQTLVPGEGAFVKIPAGGSAKVTFVGDVVQSVNGAPVSTPIPKGFSIVSSQVPQAGKIQTDLKFTPAEGDTVYQWKPGNQTWSTLSYEFGAWSAEPDLKVGEAVFMNAVAAKSWDRVFNVNQ